MFFCVNLTLAIYVIFNRDLIFDSWNVFQKKKKIKNQKSGKIFSFSNTFMIVDWKISINSIPIHQYQHKSIQLNTNQHESTRVNMNQHESNASQHESNTSQHESNTSQHEFDTSRHKSTRINTSLTRVNTSPKQVLDKTLLKI